MKKEENEKEMKESENKVKCVRASEVREISFFLSSDRFYWSMDTKKVRQGSFLRAMAPSQIISIGPMG